MFHLVRRVISLEEMGNCAERQWRTPIPHDEYIISIRLSRNECILVYQDYYACIF